MPSCFSAAATAAPTEAVQRVTSHLLLLEEKVGASWSDIVARGSLARGARCGQGENYSLSVDGRLLKEQLIATFSSYPSVYRSVAQARSTASKRIPDESYDRNGA